MRAIIRLDVPEWQIGEEVAIYFPDSMSKRAICEAEDRTGTVLYNAYSNGYSKGYSDGFNKCEKLLNGAEE